MRQEEGRRRPKEGSKKVVSRLDHVCHIGLRQRQNRPERQRVLAHDDLRRGEWDVG